MACPLSGSQIFRLLQLDSILHKGSTHPSLLHMNMAKHHRMAMIQILLLLRKHTAMGVRPLLLVNITGEVRTKSRDVFSIPPRECSELFTYYACNVENYVYKTCRTCDFAITYHFNLTF